MRIQPTRIEQLDRKHPGLRLEVDLLLDRGGRVPGQGTLEDIQQMLGEKYAETLPINTISNYKQHRWLIEKLRLRELKEIFRAVKDELGEAAISETTQARILELLDEAMRNGAKLDPHFLFKEQRLWAQHEVKLEELRQAKQKLEIEIEKSKQAVEEATHEAAKKTGEGQSLTLDDINRIRERTFGLPALAPAGPAT